MTEPDGSQWASKRRHSSRSCDQVATRDVTLPDGKKIVAGLTRVAGDHPWVREHADVFVALDDRRARVAIRSREEPADDAPAESDGRPQWAL